MRQLQQGRPAVDAGIWWTASRFPMHTLIYKKVDSQNHTGPQVHTPTGGTSRGEPP